MPSEIAWRYGQDCPELQKKLVLLEPIVVVTEISPSFLPEQLEGFIKLTVIANELTRFTVKTSVKNLHLQRTDRVCWECHREVPHGRVNSLSSTPYARVPLPESPVPDWLKEVTHK